MADNIIHSYYNDATYPYGLPANAEDPVRIYGSGNVPFLYRIELQDNHGNKIEYIESYINSVSWSFKRFGGLSDCNISIIKPYNNYGIIKPDYRILIYVNDPGAYIYQLIYQGYITDKTIVYGVTDKIDLKIAGFSTQLSRIVIGRKEPYSPAYGTPIHEILKDMFDKYITPHTDIRFRTGYVDVISDYTPDKFEFQGKAIDAIDYLAKLASSDVNGLFEYGVDKNRDFYFRKESEVETHFWLNANTTGFTEMESWENIKNRYIVKNTYYTDTFERTTNFGSTLSKTGSASTIACGKGDGARILKQTFTTNNRSISRITLKLATDGGQGWVNQITDGDMEDITTVNWKSTSTDNVEIDKSTIEVYRGTRSMHVLTKMPDEGFLYEYDVSTSGGYSVAFYSIVLDSESDMRCVISDASDPLVALEDEPIITYSDTVTRKSCGGKWVMTRIDFNITTQTKIHIKFMSDNTWTSEFWVDEVYMYKHHGLLTAFIMDNADLNYFYDDNANIRSTIPLSKVITSHIVFLLENGTDVNLDFHLFEADSTKQYALILAPYNLVMDNNTYFEFKYGATGAESEQTLSYYDSVNGWVDVSSTAVLCMEIQYNISQELFGLREEFANPAQTDSLTTKKWCDASLAALDMPQKRATYSLEGLRTVFDDKVSTRGIGKVAFRKPGGTALPSQLTDNFSQQFLYEVTDPKKELYQSFVHNHDYVIHNIKLKLRKYSTPTGTIYIELQEDIGGRPSGYSFLGDNGEGNGISMPIDVATEIPNTYPSDCTEVDFRFYYYGIYWCPVIPAYRRMWLILKSDDMTLGIAHVQVGFNTSDDYTDGTSAYITVSQPNDFKAFIGDFYFVIEGSEYNQALDVDTISYKISETGIDTTINAGTDLPNISKILKRLEHDIATRTSGTLF